MLDKDLFEKWHDSVEFDDIADQLIGTEVLVRRKHAIFTYYNGSDLDINHGVGYVIEEGGDVYIIGCENITECEEFEWKLLADY